MTKQLEELIRYHNKAYFELHAPEISDEEFDKLVETLRVLNSNSPVLTELQAPGSVKHTRPMLSLDKCYDDDTLFKWREKIQGGVIAMPKIDGVACSIHYDRNGGLSLAATRGDGEQGEDITNNVRQIANVPKNSHSNMEVRGEVYMTLSRFARHYKDQFVNPRNLAAGALKQKDSNKSAAYGLSFFPYDLLGTELSTEEQKFVQLKEMGFTTPPVMSISSDDEAKRAYAEYAHRRSALDYEIDGVVFRANQLSEQRRLGITAHHPRYAIAYKFQGESAQTELIDVEWSIARTGVITPVAVVKPVFVSGATVTRASLHNFGLFQKHDLAAGSLVEIVRRGGVIPHLERVLAKRGIPIEAPTQCPSCGSDVVIDGDFLRCSKPLTCPDIAVGRFSYFCGALDIQGFGEKLIRTLVDHKLFVRLGDLYRLREEQLTALDRVGEKLAKKLLTEIAKKRELELEQLLTSLGFEEIGPTVSENVTMQFKTLEALRAASKEDLSQIDGVGESIASSLVDHLQRYSDEIDDLLTEVRIKAPRAQKEFATDHPLYNKSVVFTGTLKHLERKDAQKRVRDFGGHTPSSVTKETDYLIVGEGKKSTKQKAAEALIAAGSAIQIMSEDDFVKASAAN